MPPRGHDGAATNGTVYLVVLQWMAVMMPGVRCSTLPITVHSNALYV